MGSAFSEVADCCTNRSPGAHNSGKGCRGSSQGQKADSLVQALEMFREKGASFVQGAGGDECMAQWDAACGLVEALLTGVTRHLSKVHVRAEVWAAALLPASGPPCGTREKVLSLTARLDPAPLLGVTPTRSRMCADVCLDGTVRFTLLSPPSSQEDGPLVLEVEGLNFKLPPDIRFLRWRLKNELGENYDPEHVYEWYKENIDEVWPLDRSKGRRVLEALFENRSWKVTVPNSMNAITAFALINGASTSIRTLELTNDSRHGIRVSASRGPPIAPETAEEVERGDEILRSLLIRDNMWGEMFAPSSFNFMRMVHGSSVGQPGASVDKLKKLLTAAHTWGPGTDGWHRFDETWEAVDKKDALGRTTQENGRLVWHMPGDDF